MPGGDLYFRSTDTVQRLQSDANLRSLHGSVTLPSKSQYLPEDRYRNITARNSGQTRVSDAENEPGVAIGFSGDPGAQRYHVRAILCGAQ
jgi:hypothetical protein